MNRNNLKTLRVLAVCSAALLFAACGQQEQPAADAGAPASDATKIPLTTASATARELYEQGLALNDDLRATEAHSMFTKAVAADPDFAMGHVMVSITAQNAAEFFEAVGKAGAAAAGASEGEQLIVAAAVAGSENNQAAQLEALTKLLEMFPQDERAHLLMANFKNGQQDFAAAVAHYTHATKINPEFATAYNALGYANRSIGDLDAAKNAFARYVELIPDKANPYDSYAELLMEMGDYDESIVNYEKALEINENFPSAYAGLSINYSLKGQPDRAQVAAERMLSAARTPAERRAALFQTATSHLFAGNTAGAMDALDTMTGEALAKGNHAAAAGVADYVGDILLTEGEPAKAQEQFDKALDHRLQANLSEANLAQANRTHLFKSAVSAMVAGDLDTAASLAAEYSAAVQNNGTTFEKRRAHEIAGYIAMGDDMEAGLAQLAQANQLDPVVLYWSAYGHNELGNQEQARDFAHRAATKNTLNGNLPFFRDEAIALLAELDAG